MKMNRNATAIVTVILCVCLLSAASGATEVSEKYYETLLETLAPAEEGIAFTDDELAQYQTLTVGDKGEYVLKLKDRMYELGYFRNPTANDTFTPTTAEYVETFQELNGLDVTGVATPEMQALFYSGYAAVGPNAENYVEIKPDLEITYGKIIQYKTVGSAFQLNIQNNTGKMIDTYYVIAIPFTADGVPGEMADTLLEQLVSYYLVEDYDLTSGGKLYSMSRRLAFVISGETYYPNVVVAVIAYETSDGELVTTYSPDSIWYGCGKAVPNGSFTEEGNTAVTYPTQEEQAAAGRWSFGASFAYIPAVYRDYYDVPEGVYVFSVVTNSAAGVAGLRNGDILIALGDVLTNCDESATAAIGRIKAGDSVDALYWRNGVFYLTRVTR